MKKLRNFISLALSAVLGVSAASGTVGVSAASEQAEENHDWIPSSFDDALEFYNTYGRTHIEGNTVCYVRKVHTYSEKRPELVYVSDSDISEPTTFETFKWSGSADDTSFGGGDGERVPVIAYAEPVYVSFEFDVYTFEVSGKDCLEFYESDSMSDNYCRESGYFSFECGRDGLVVETDVFAWLPDCITEYNDYIKKNGSVSVNGNGVVFCGGYNPSTGASLIFNQYGTAQLSEVIRFHVSRTHIMEDMIAGAGCDCVCLYRPIDMGTVHAEWINARTWEVPETTSERNEAFFEVDDSMRISVIGEDDMGVPKSSKNIDILTLTSSRNGVVEYLELFGSDDNFAMEKQTCYSVLEPAAAEKYGFNIFRDSSDGKSVLVYGGKAYSVGKYFGGYGLVSAAVADLNGDGKIEIYFTTSWGSGMQRSEISYFDTAAETMIYMPLYCSGCDLVLTAEDGGLAVYSANVTFAGGLGVNCSYNLLSKVIDISYNKDRIAAQALSKRVYSTGATGDANHDGVFNVADIVMLQRWIMGAADASVANEVVADFNGDGELNVFDLCLMRRALTEDAAKKRAVITVETTCKYTGIMGSDRGTETLTDSFEIREGDVIYEDRKGGLTKENFGPEALEIISISDSGVTVKKLSDIGLWSEKEIPFGTEAEVISQASVPDLVYYKYKVSFSAK